MLLRVLAAEALAASLTGGVVEVATAAILGLDFDPLGLPGLRGGSAGPSLAEGTLQRA